MSATRRDSPSSDQRGRGAGRGVLAGPADAGAAAKAPDCPIADLVTAGLDTVAIRVPSHPVAQALLRAAGVPVAAPSANRSGHVSPTTAAHVEADLGDTVAMILDDGPSALGIEFDGGRSVRRRRQCCCGPAPSRRTRSKPCSACRSSARHRRRRAAALARPAREPLRAARHASASTRPTARPGEALLAFGPAVARP